MYAMALSRYVKFFGITYEGMLSEIKLRGFMKNSKKCFTPLHELNGR